MFAGAGRIVATIVALFLGGAYVLAPLTSALGHPGHDHGPPAPEIRGELLPRTTAHSDLFEVVVIKAQERMLIFLDDYVGNTPVVGATLEVLAAGELGAVAEIGPGVYAADWSTPPGSVDITVIVGAGERSDLLLATLDVPSEEIDAPSTLFLGSLMGSREMALLPVVALLLVVVFLLAAALIRLRRSRSAPATAGVPEADGPARQTEGDAATVYPPFDSAPRLLRTGS